MTVTIHRGAAEIGGTCIEISSGSTRLILDVGRPLDDLARLRERVSQDELPNVPGLFHRGAKVDAVLLSHAHADHTGLLPKVLSEIPIYLSRGTSKMMMAGSIFAGQPKLDRSREKVFGPGRSHFSIGNIAVTALPVNHSAFDSYAFLLESGGKRVLYSGDLRLHGPDPELEANVTREATNRPVDLMLMEGTNIGRSPGGCASEHEVQKKIQEAMEACLSLVLANFSPMHVDRMRAFYKAAQASGRMFVVDIYGAFVLHLVSGQRKLPKPTRENGIGIYYNRSFEATFRKRNLEKIHTMFTENRIHLDEVLSCPRKHAFLFRPSMLTDDFENGLPARTCCVYSYWSGYLKQEQYGHLRDQLATIGGDLLQIHTSGHILYEDIIRLVRAIKPRAVAGIHTDSSSMFQEYFPNSVVVKNKVPISLQ